MRAEVDEIQTARDALYTELIERSDAIIEEYDLDEGGSIIHDEWDNVREIAVNYLALMSIMYTQVRAIMPNHPRTVKMGDMLQDTTNMILGIDTALMEFGRGE